MIVFMGSKINTPEVPSFKYPTPGMGVMPAVNS